MRKRRKDTAFLGTMQRICPKSVKKVIFLTLNRYFEETVQMPVFYSELTLWLF
jgi:hypothetical protein